MESERVWERLGYPAEHLRPFWLTIVGLALILVSVHQLVALAGVVGVLGGFLFFLVAGLAFSAARWAHWWNSFRRQRTAKTKCRPAGRALM